MKNLHSLCHRAINERSAKKIMSVILSVVFLFNVVYVDTARSVVLPQEMIDVRMDPMEVSIPESLDIVVPFSLGEVQDRFAGENGRTIIHIQDAHCNYSAQRSIASIIQHLKIDRNIEIIFLEGGAGRYDLSLFRDIRDPNLREKVTDVFVRDGRVSGPEYFATVHPYAVELYGIEDPLLYFKNLDAYQKFIPHHKDAHRLIGVLENGIKNFKNRVYGKELIDADRSLAAYREKSDNFKERLMFLKNSCDIAGIDISGFGNFNALFKVIGMEKQIDFRNAERQRRILFERFNEALSVRDMESLVLKMSQFKGGDISSDDFYAFILKKAEVSFVDYSDLADLVKYSEYIYEYGKIDKIMLYNEIKDIEEIFMMSLMNEEDQKELYVLDMRLELIKQLFDAALVKEQYTKFSENRNEYRVKDFIDFFTKKGPVYGLNVTIPENISILDKFIDQMGDFYSYALKRDEAFLNIINAKLDNEGLDLAILVTGGFHQKNLERLFREKGYSYVSVMPRLRVEKHSPYFTLLAGENSNLRSFTHSVLNYLPQRSTIAIKSLFSEMGIDMDNLRMIEFERDVIKKLLSAPGENFVYATNWGEIIISMKPKQKDVPGFEVEIGGITISAELRIGEFNIRKPDVMLVDGMMLTEDQQEQWIDQLAISAAREAGMPEGVTFRDLEGALTDNGLTMEGLKSTLVNEFGLNEDDIRFVFDKHGIGVWASPIGGRLGHVGKRSLQEEGVKEMSQIYISPILMDEKVTLRHWGKNPYQSVALILLHEVAAARGVSHWEVELDIHGTRPEDFRDRAGKLMDIAKSRPAKRYDMAAQVGGDFVSGLRDAAAQADMPGEQADGLLEDDVLGHRPGYKATVLQVPSKGTDRVGQEGRATLRIFEVFELELTPEEIDVVLGKIRGEKATHVVLLNETTIKKAQDGRVKVVLTEDMGLFHREFLGKEVTIGDNAPAVIDNARSDSVESVKAAQEIRVSPAGLYSIKVRTVVDGVEQELYLLSFNKNRLKKGKLQITPIGGAYDFKNQEGKELYEKAGIKMTPEDESKPLEMRQIVDQSGIDLFLEMFHQGVGREITPVRELREEVVGTASEEDVFAEMPANVFLWSSVFDKYNTPEAVKDGLMTALTDTNVDMGLLQKACDLAIYHHARAENYIRDDGRAYSFHPLEVAYYMVTGLGIVDQVSILSAILHDLTEDTPISLDEIRTIFGVEVADVVEDMVEDRDIRRHQGRLAAKLEHLDRVQKSGRTPSIVIKVIDRLQNLYTNESPTNQKQRRMELAEIDRWIEFLDLEIIPKVLRADIMPFLERERSILERGTAMSMADMSSHENVVQQFIESRYFKMLELDTSLDEDIRGTVRTIAQIIPEVSLPGIFHIVNVINTDDRVLDGRSTEDKLAIIRGIIIQLGERFSGEDENIQIHNFTNYLFRVDMNWPGIKGSDELKKIGYGTRDMAAQTDMPGDETTQLSVRKERDIAEGEASIVLEVPGQTHLKVATDEVTAAEEERFRRYLDESGIVNAEILDSCSKGLFRGQETLIAIGRNSEKAKELDPILQDMMQGVKREADGIILEFKIGTVNIRFFDENNEQAVIDLEKEVQSDRYGKTSEERQKRAIVFMTREEGQSRRAGIESDAFVLYVDFHHDIDTKLMPVEGTVVSGLAYLDRGHIFREAIDKYVSVDKIPVAVKARINEATRRFGRRLALMVGTDEYDKFIESIVKDKDGILQLLRSGDILVRIRPIDIGAIRAYYEAEIEVLRSL